MVISSVWIRTLRSYKNSFAVGWGHATSYPFEHGERNTETAVTTTTNPASLRAGIPHTFTVGQLPPRAFPRIDTEGATPATLFATARLHLDLLLPPVGFVDGTL